MFSLIHSYGRPLWYMSVWGEDSAMQCRTVQCNVNSVQCSAVLDTVQCSPVHYSAWQFIQCSTVRRSGSIPQCMCVAAGHYWTSIQTMHVVLYCTALYYTALHCTEQHCTSLHWTKQHCTALHYIELHCTSLKGSAVTALHCTEKYCSWLHCTTLYWTALHITALICTALNCTALYCTALHCSN